MSEGSLVQEFGGRSALRVRVYVGERDHHGGQPLYTAIVDAARRAGLGGATVIKGIEGFGSHSVVHAARIVDLSSDLPVIVEIVDEPARIAPFVDVLRGMIEDGMMTLESVCVIDRRAGTQLR